MENKDHSLRWISLVKSRKDEHQFVGTSLWESLHAFGSWFNQQMCPGRRCHRSDGQRKFQGKLRSTDRLCLLLSNRDVKK